MKLLYDLLMNVLITGATGFIGQALTRRLLYLGHNVSVLSRKSENETRAQFDLPYKHFQWAEPDKTPAPKIAFQNIDAVCNLAGESVTNQKWTSSQKQKLYSSRVALTKNLVQTMNQFNVSKFVSTSAVGIYGEQGSKEIVESNIYYNNFLGQLCQQWETEALKSTASQKSILRLGSVLDYGHGMLAKLAPIFSAHIGGPIGSGRQHLSWIHIDDLLSLYVACLTNSKYSGTFNATSPQSCTNKDFTNTLAQSLYVKAKIPIPKFALKVLYGEMSHIIFDSCKALPERALDLGFSFKFSNINDALKQIFDWKKSAKDQRYLYRQWINIPLKETFEFFSEPKNLERITPVNTAYKVIHTTDTRIKAGTIYKFKLYIYGVPFVLSSVIIRYKALEMFTDKQTKGPYKKWEHEHRFFQMKSGTYIYDDICYRIPFGILGRLALKSIFHKNIDRFFKYRYKKIQQIL